MVQSLAVNTVDLSFIARKDIEFLSKSNRTPISFLELQGTGVFKANFEPGVSIGSAVVLQLIAGVILSADDVKSLDELILVVKYV